MGLDGDWLWRFHRHVLCGQRTGTGLGRLRLPGGGSELGGDAKLQRRHRWGEPAGRGSHRQRLVRAGGVVFLAPGVQRGLQRPDARKRAVHVEQFALEGLVEALDLPRGVGERTLVRRWVMPFSRQIRSNNTSTGTPGLWNRPVNTLPLSVRTSSGTP
jgi:hypothetical protein